GLLGVIWLWVYEWAGKSGYWLKGAQCIDRKYLLSTHLSRRRPQPPIP
ncbi:MAG: hypothetical protein ACI8UZ_001736, partial [Akkermansiaceae bacterium]